MRGQISLSCTCPAVFGGTLSQQHFLLLFSSFFFSLSLHQGPAFTSSRKNGDHKCFVHFLFFFVGKLMVFDCQSFAAFWNCQHSQSRPCLILAEELVFFLSLYQGLVVSFSSEYIFCSASVRGHVSWLVFWAQQTTRDYIMVQGDFHKETYSWKDQ